jgi:hypothetical protein
MLYSLTWSGRNKAMFLFLSPPPGIPARSKAFAEILEPRLQSLLQARDAAAILDQVHD